MFIKGAQGDQGIPAGGKGVRQGTLRMGWLYRMDNVHPVYDPHCMGIVHG